MYSASDEFKSSEPKKPSGRDNQYEAVGIEGLRDTVNAKTYAVAVWATTERNEIVNRGHKQKQQGDTNSA